ncbi:protein-glutamate O-methyltransferase [uncultured Ferrovibrio sp.]|jgi:chemotaxis protein methyltransferase CheR|uniref:CheR family methyltransferase n=1 Tax=uncultured Ferrovibrio sp. TaxID=1576913 RepID=UPI00260EB189|nr:protein-glutamate O-methyltransferase [uncultured Ferrovibrio sp.]
MTIETRTRDNRTIEAPSPEDREFSFSLEDYAFLRAMLKERTGIELGPTKQNMVYARLAKRLRRLGMKSFRQYIEFIGSDEGRDELGTTLNALTTNLTKFFRENHHFEHLGTTALQEIRARASTKGRRLRIWSAGCSSGEEPYSIAITLLQSMPDIKQWDAKILATDIDTEMVRRGAEGIYPVSALEGVPPDARKYFEPVGEDRVQLCADARNLVSFKYLNLIGHWPMKGPFDVIFCRNVVIYFDKDTQRTLFDRYANLLVPGGFLYIGHSENLFGITERFKLLGRNIHRKIA